jgi:hypothetical protein
MRRARLLACALGAVALLGACGEEVQTTKVGPARKADKPAWSGGESPYRVSGWTPGDRASWEAQMRARAQGQDDYAQR